MASGSERVPVVITRHYKIYRPGDEAWFAPEEADTIVKAGFGHHRVAEGEDASTESLPPASRMKRTRYKDKQLRPEEE